ncbi:Uncharacterised protein [uncultured archaeon]|nr:Uncharacterised protein [uncultured archaeon]
MVSVSYSHRLLCDADFILWLSTQQGKETILSYLMHIKSSSEYCKREHNLILKKEAELCKDKLDSKYLGGAFKVIEEPELLDKYEEKITKNIIFGINLTDDPPFKCYLFTSPEKQREYESNKHYQGITNLQIVSGEKAINVIKGFFSAFNSARETER